MRPESIVPVKTIILKLHTACTTGCLQPVAHFTDNHGCPCGVKVKNDLGNKSEVQAEVRPGAPEMAVSEEKPGWDWTVTLGGTIDKRP